MFTQGELRMLRRALKDKLAGMHEIEREWARVGADIAALVSEIGDYEALLEKVKREIG